jgi:hypothetical protein
LLTLPRIKGLRFAGFFAPEKKFFLINSRMQDNHSYSILKSLAQPSFPRFIVLHVAVTPVFPQAGESKV